MLSRKRECGNNSNCRLLSMREQTHETVSSDAVASFELAARTLEQLSALNFAEGGVGALLIEA